MLEMGQIFVISAPDVSKQHDLSYVHWSVHRESMSIVVQQDATIYSLLYSCKLLYMFRVVAPLIIRSTYNCNYSIGHWSNCLCYLPLKLKLEVSTLSTSTSARCSNYNYMCS